MIQCLILLWIKKEIISRLKHDFNYKQKARLARIRLAKATSGAAFLSKKRAVESRLLAQESGLGLDGENGAGGADDQHWLREEDIFELQHHHLLRCLEKATVSHFLFNYYALISWCPKGRQHICIARLTFISSPF